MRIIAGEYRSRRLVAPQGMETRPTADKVREALFSILQARVPGARVLDLYAGSGALALEALSRGAAIAVLGDQSPKAWKAIWENIAALRCQDRASLRKGTDSAVLAALEKEGAAFDLIFLDPPYKLDTGPVCARLCADGLLAPGGMIVVEHAKATPPRVEAPLLLKSRREYGMTGLSFYLRMGEE